MKNYVKPLTREIEVRMNLCAGSGIATSTKYTGGDVYPDCPEMPMDDYLAFD